MVMHGFCKPENSVRFRVRAPFEDGPMENDSYLSTLSRCSNGGSTRWDYQILAIKTVNFINTVIVLITEENLTPLYKIIITNIEIKKAGISPIDVIWELLKFAVDPINFENLNKI